MDSFSIIQNYFSNLQCSYCDAHFEPEGIQLIREQQGFFVVSVGCAQCGKHNGVAMVGVETSEEGGLDQDVVEKTKLETLKRRRRFKDPELTKAELKRLEQFDPISEDDVLDAHHFFQNLDANWTELIPSEIRQRYTNSDTESPST